MFTGGFIMERYDLAVIGAGSAGLVAALTANRAGKRVAMLEKNKIGGECTHSGCIPSKTFISSARVFHAMNTVEALGLASVHTGYFDFAGVMEHVNSVVQGIYAREQPQVFQDQGIDVFVHNSGARFLNDREIQLGDKVIQATHTIICTGSSPRVVPITGHRAGDIFTNESFWETRVQPHSIVFLGGGVIAAELGQALVRLGTDVTIVDLGPRILRVVDDEVAELAIAALQEDGIRVLSNSLVTSCSLREEGPNTIFLEQEGEERQIQTDAVLFATMGRVPNIAGLDLEKAGVEYDQRGIKTNDYLQTTTENIYAAGDVTTPFKFTHTASYQARVCIQNILHGNQVVNDLSVLPWVIFMDPEIGHVGLSEAQAREQYGDVHVFKVGTGTVDRFITESETTGFMKVVMDENDNILGADAIGAHAGEWIQFITLAMKSKLPITAFTDMIFAYPSFSEIVQKVFSRYLRTKIK
jgi:pyruvate/2-oxoglutarate dehydrogenase complex dihydrolipoamide dehydrogenase (E3) component